MDRRLSHSHLRLLPLLRVHNKVVGLASVISAEVIAAGEMPIHFPTSLIQHPSKIIINNWLNLQQEGTDNLSGRQMTIDVYGIPGVDDLGEKRKSQISHSRSQRTVPQLSASGNSKTSLIY